MAGDWIKVEHATLGKPEIGIAAEVLGISEGETLLLFMRYWVWLDQNLDETRPGRVPFVSRKSLEKRFNCDGFAAILERVKWATFDDVKQILTVTNWERHNGKSAKSRALEQRKKAKQRAKVSLDCPVVIGTDAALEKRRGLSMSIPSGFAISERVKTWAAAKGHANLDAHFEHFQGYAIATGKTYKDWDQALMNAIRDNWAKVGNLKTVRGSAGDWWSSEAATVAKGREVGLEARGNESWNDFRGRIRVALEKLKVA